MRNKLVILLEQKREELGEEVGAFAKRIFPTYTARTARSLYCRICAGKQLVPIYSVTSIAKFLNLDYSEARQLNSNKIDYRNLRFTHEELRKMADIVEDSGEQLPLHLLFNVLEQSKER